MCVSVCVFVFRFLVFAVLVGFDFKSATESPAFGTGGAHSPLEMQLAASYEASRSEPAIRLYIPHPLPHGRVSWEGGLYGIAYRCTCTFLVFILVSSFFCFRFFSMRMSSARAYWNYNNSRGDSLSSLKSSESYEEVWVWALFR